MATKNCRREPSEIRHLVETEVAGDWELSPHTSLFSDSAKGHCEEKSYIRESQGPRLSTFRDKYEGRPRRTDPSHCLNRI